MNKLHNTALALWFECIWSDWVFNYS